MEWVFLDRERNQTVVLANKDPYSHIESFGMLKNKLCIPAINPNEWWRIIPFIFLDQYAKIWLRILASMFMRDIVL